MPPGLGATARSQIDAVVRLVRDVLGDSAEAAYLYGSAVRDGLRADSDLDILVVATRRTTDGERRALIRGLLSISRTRDDPGATRHLEVTLVVRSDVQPWRYPPPMELQYGDWWRREFEAGDFSPWTSPNPDLAVLLTAARAEGMALFGPPAAELLDAVPGDDLRRALRDVVPNLLKDLDDDTRNVLLTLARVWVTLETGSIVPKDEAAAWALARLPEGRGDALRSARAAYLGAATEAWEDAAAMASARADAAAMVEIIEEGRRRTG